MKPSFAGAPALAIAIMGSILYACLAFGVIFDPPYPHFGSDLYNAYYYRLIDGRFDLPLRMLRIEGHYTADGVGIMYHGIAPLLTRVLLDPFVALNSFPTASFSIWLWAVTGTGFYHLSVFQVMRKYAGDRSDYPVVLWTVLAGVAAWLCAPGLFLSANAVLYHEPISIAYAAMAIAVFIMLRCALFGMPVRRALVPLALLAVVLIHSRPHLAVGLYAGIVLLIVLAIWRRSEGVKLSAVISLAILGLAALSYLQLNTLRFGSATAVHGGLEDTAAGEVVQFGPVYFGTDYATTGRGVAFREHGSFHPWRIVPNFVVYAFDHPSIALQVDAAHLAVTEQWSGWGKIENPRFGMFFVWTFWFLAMCASLFAARPRFAGGIAALPLLATTGITAIMMLSYVTLAYRYRFELWPFMMALTLLGFPGLMNRFGTQLLASPRVRMLCIFAIILGISSSGSVLFTHLFSYSTAPGGKYAEWSVAECEAMIAHHNYTQERLDVLCVDPETVFADAEGR